MILNAGAVPRWPSERESIHQFVIEHYRSRGEQPRLCCRALIEMLLEAAISTHNSV